MSLDITAETLSDMVSDMTDLFSDSIDSDGLQTLLSYYLQLSRCHGGRITLDSLAHLPDIDVSLRSLSMTNSSQHHYLADQARLTLVRQHTVIDNGGQLVGHYVFPLRSRGTALGVVQLFKLDEPECDEDLLIIMQGLTDLAASVIDQSHRVKQAYLLVSQLQNALDSRVVIEQAKGVVAERDKVNFSQAFHEIRMRARREQKPVRSVAADIVASYHHAISLNHSQSR